MRPGATYRAARRNEAKKARKKLKARTVGAAMLTYKQILQVNQMRQAREKAATAAA